MKYELWDVTVYGEGEPPVPFTLLNKSDDFSEIYYEFQKTAKDRPCVIFLKTDSAVEPVSAIRPSEKKIYESPDGGETVYERSFGDTYNRKRVK